MQKVWIVGIRFPDPALADKKVVQGNVGFVPTQEDPQLAGCTRSSPAACLAMMASSSGSTNMVPFPVSIPTVVGIGHRVIGCWIGTGWRRVVVLDGLRGQGGSWNYQDGGCRCWSFIC